MRRLQDRSPAARAVLPVLAGVGFFGVLALLLWGAAAYIAHHGEERSSDFAPTMFDVTSTKSAASFVTEDGPLIFPDLLQSNGKRTIVLDHTGTDADHGWRIYLAYPADRDVTCKVTQIRHTRNFTDCAGRTLPVEDLADPPAGVVPIVANGKLSLDLLPDSAATVTTVGTASG